MGSDRQVRGVALREEFLSGWQDFDVLRDVAACSTAVAAALKVQDSERAWTVVGLMTTRHPEPAAFTRTPRVAFCLLADVHEIVTNDELVGLGLHGASVRNT